MKPNNRHSRECNDRRTFLKKIAGGTGLLIVGGTSAGIVTAPGSLFAQDEHHQ